MVQRTGVVGHDVMGLVASRTTFRATHRNTTQLYSVSIYEFQYIYFHSKKRILFGFSNLCVHLCMKTFIIHSVFTCTREYIKCLSDRVCLLCYIANFMLYEIFNFFQHFWLDLEDILWTRKFVCWLFVFLHIFRKMKIILAIHINVCSTSVEM